MGKLSAEEKKEKIHRYLKKRNERNFSKKIKVNYGNLPSSIYIFNGIPGISKLVELLFLFKFRRQYACRKTLADSRPRVRGRFAKNDDFGETQRLNSSSHEEDDDDEV